MLTQPLVVDNKKNLNNDNISNTNNPDDLHTEEFKNFIIRNYIKPDTENEIKNILSNRKRYLCLSNTFYIFGEIFGFIQTIISFTNTYYNNITLSFIGGLCGVLAILFFRIGSKCTELEKENTEKVNEILKNLNINESVQDLSISEKEK